MRSSVAMTFAAHVRSSDTATEHLSDSDLLTLLIGLKNAAFQDSSRNRDLRTMTVDDMRSAIQSMKNGEIADLGIVQISAISPS